MKIYDSHIKNRQAPAVQYTLLYNGLLAMEKGRFEKALEYFSHQKTLLEQGLIYSRYNLAAMTNIAKALAGMGRYTHDGGCIGLLLYTSTVFLSATYIPIRMQAAPTTK